MKIAVHGSYFGRNFGDTLLIKIVTDWIKEFGYEDIVLPMIDNTMEEKEIGVRKMFNIDLKTIDFLVFAGGGYFGEPNTNIIKRYFWYYRNWNRHLRWVQKMNPKSIIGIGIGFGPLSSNFARKRVFDFMNQCKFLYFRDKKSIEYMNEYNYKNKNVKLGVDLAISLQEKHKILDVKNNDIIGLHIPVWKKTLSDEYFKLLSFLLDFNNVEIICDAPKQEELLNMKDSFYSRLLKKKKLKINIYNGPENLISLLQKCRLVITSKLHVGIVATSIGVPVYSIPTHSKVIRYHEQIRNKNNCNPIYDFDNRKHERIISNINNITFPVIPKELIKTIDEMKNNLKLEIEYTNNL